MIGKKKITSKIGAVGISLLRIDISSPSSSSSQWRCLESSGTVSYSNIPEPEIKIIN